MLNIETAKNSPKVINDGFVQPHLLWCANTPEHLNLFGSSLFSNFWIGKPEVVKKVANKIAEFYTKYIQENSIDLCEDHSISVAYWEIDGIGMIAEIYSVSELFDVLPENILADYEDELTQILFNGNDNHPGLVLDNSDCDLSVEQRLSLAKLMDKESMDWIEFDDHYLLHGLIDFSDQEIQQILDSFVDNSKC